MSVGVTTDQKQNKTIKIDYFDKVNPKEWQFLDNIKIDYFDEVNRKEWKLSIKVKQYLISATAL
jgi:Fe-S cluster assembly iron-binding protein IscA